MTEELKTKEQILASFPTNTDGEITAARLRDFVASIYEEEHPPHGGVHIVDPPVETTITTQDEFTKIAGTTEYSGAHRHKIDDGGVHNRLRYTGTREIHFHIVAQASVVVPANNQVISLKVFHFDASANGGAGAGSYLEHSRAKNKSNANGDVMQIATHADLVMGENDYVELHVSNGDGTANITAEELYMFAMGMQAQRGWRG